MDPCAVRMTGITKSFGGNRVLHGVDFDLVRGEIHVRGLTFGAVKG